MINSSVTPHAFTFRGRLPNASLKKCVAGAPLDSPVLREMSMVCVPVDAMYRA